MEKCKACAMREVDDLELKRLVHCLSNQIMGLMRIKYGDCSGSYLDEGILALTYIARDMREVLNKNSGVKYVGE